MSGVLKIDPWALLEERKRTTTRTEQALATFATLADPPSESENLYDLRSRENAKSQRPPAKFAKPAKAAEPVAKLAKPVAVQWIYSEALNKLEGCCPDYVEPERWQQCIEDGRVFLATWGERAAALGWTVEELFGLHRPPAHPHPSYHRLSRYDVTGLIWGLEGRRVVALTDTTAAVESFTGNILIYRKANKPALGPFGDSLDHFIA